MCGYLWQLGPALRCLGALPQPSRGATTVTGADDRSSPLVIQPSGAGQVDQTYYVLLFIQKMPVTKTVNRITLGDIGVGPDCVGTGLRLYVLPGRAG